MGWLVHPIGCPVGQRVKIWRSRAFPFISVDDHPLVVEGVKKLLSHDERIEVVAHASNGPEALRQLRHYPEVSLAIVDMNMPGDVGY